MHIIVTRMKKADAIGMRDFASALTILRRSSTFPKIRKTLAILSNLSTRMCTDRVDMTPATTMATSRWFHGDLRNGFHQFAAILKTSSDMKANRKNIFADLIFEPRAVSEPSGWMRSSFNWVSKILSTKFWKIQMSRNLSRMSFNDIYQSNLCNFPTY